MGRRRKRDTRFDDLPRCAWAYSQRRIVSGWMRCATAETTQANLFRARRSVFGDFEEVPFDAWRDMAERNEWSLADD